MATVKTAPRGSRPPIRIRRAPRTDPPFDDELDPEAWAIPNQLAFDWPPPEGATSTVGGARSVESPGAAGAAPGLTAGSVTGAARGSTADARTSAATGSAAGTGRRSAAGAAPGST